MTSIDHGLHAAAMPRRLFVLGHPNHELAIFGLIQEWRPHLLYLTDGGGAQRVAETKRGLERIGLLGQASFLDHDENDFYAALLRRNHDYFESVADQVRHRVDEIGATEVICESVEFYNPVHDVTLPVVRCALAGREEVAVKEFPLIYQCSAPGEPYRVQRFPCGWDTPITAYPLSETQLAAKIAAKEQVYHCLNAQLGALLDGLPRAEVATEYLGAAQAVIRSPAADQCLRYERRGALLRERGEVAEVITLEDCFLPVVQALGVS